MQNKLPIILLVAGAVVILGGIWLVFGQPAPPAQSPEGIEAGGERVVSQDVEYFNGVTGYLA